MNQTASATIKAVGVFGCQSKLAEAIGVTQQSISNWINGKSKPTVKAARAIEYVTNKMVTKEDLRPDIYSADIAVNLPSLIDRMNLKKITNRNSSI